MDMSGQTAELIIADAEFRKTPGYKALTTTDKFPMLQTEHGCLHESSAISKYFCSLAGNKHLGTNSVERSQVDQWISFSNTSIFPSVIKVAMAIFGWGPVSKADYDDGFKNLKAHVKTMNSHLEGKQWLVGNEITLADVVLSQSLYLGFSTVLDAGFRKAMKNIAAWAQRCYDHPSCVKTLGHIKMCAKALKPVLVEEAKPVKKEAPKAVPKAEKKVEEKPKDNVESLPPTPFNVYDFKTFYVNHPDKKGEAVDEWYKMLDWEGWSFWYLHYDKYEGEGVQLHVTNNLMNGFLSRAEHTSKYTFGRHGVFGEEPELEIMGVWLMRGLVLPDGLAKEHPQFEYYKSRKMDPRNNKDDDKLVREFFGGKEEEVINGLKCQTLRWHK